MSIAGEQKTAQKILAAAKKIEKLKGKLKAKGFSRKSISDIASGHRTNPGRSGNVDVKYEKYKQHISAAKARGSAVEKATKGDFYDDPAYLLKRAAIAAAEPRDWHGRFESGGGSERGLTAQQRYSAKFGREIKEVMRTWADGGVPEIRDYQASGKNGRDMYVEFDDNDINTVVWSNAKSATELQRTIVEAPNYNGVLYRGMELTRPERDKLRVGRVITMKAISSTSERVTIAEHFAGNDKDAVVFKIYSRQGLRLASALRTGYANEREVLVPRGAKYRVEQVGRVIQTPGDDPILVVVMRQVN